MGLRGFARNWWRRASSASKTDAVLAIILFASKVYAVAFAIWMGGAKFSAWMGPGAEGFWLFVACLAYSTAQPYFPKRVSKKWVIEDVRRTKAISLAISEISSALFNHNVRPEAKHEIFSNLLVAIKSEVEGITADHEGIYFNVALLLLEDNDERLRVVCRANHDRPLTSYRRTELVVAQCLTTGDVFYEPNFASADKPYKSIFGIPLISNPANSKMFASGVVSIDSSEAFRFDGIEDEIEAKTLPYVSLLKLLIQTDETLRSGKWRQNGGNSKA